MPEESSSCNEMEMQNEQAASAAGPPLEAQRNEDSKDKDASNDVPETPQSELSRTAIVLVLVPVILTYFLWFLDLAVLSTATPAITSEFKSIVDVGWYAWKTFMAAHLLLLANNRPSGTAERINLAVQHSRR